MVAAATLTPFARFAFGGPSPLNLITGPAGAGKTRLADLISEITLGRPMDRLGCCRHEAEIGMRITALLVNGTNAVLIDNESTLDSVHLEIALEGGEWQDRLCGESRVVRLPVTVTWYATARDRATASGLSNRCLHIGLKSQEPTLYEGVQSESEPFFSAIRADRSHLIAASLTVLRAYCLAGRPNMRLPAWSAFHDWSRLVRHAVVWAGLVDPYC